MNIEFIEIDHLVPDPKNLRKHPDRNIEVLVSSLQRFGQQKPVVIDCANKIIAGNATCDAARKLGWKKVYAVRTELEGDEATAFAIVDNRVPELGEWAYDGLLDRLMELGGSGVDPALLGFNAAEMENLTTQAEAAADAIANIGEYDPSKDLAFIKVDGVKHEDKETLVDTINKALEGTQYRAVAY